MGNGHIGVLGRAVQDQFRPSNIPSMPHLSNALLDFSLTDEAPTIVSEFAVQAEECAKLWLAIIAWIDITEPAPVVFDVFSAPVPIARDDAGVHDSVPLARDGAAIRSTRVLRSHSSRLHDGGRNVIGLYMCACSTDFIENPVFKGSDSRIQD
ncbi:hypothetical protein V500_00883 [Pseudogymnoascus sp. VKM F-4518 (FW-2643)]|nr:hypothetical protein V500_00883 [Pseudogymnoascus sp. VKM F-4518 (FW-2643)]